jgi:hypothetical protein
MNVTGSIDGLVRTLAFGQVNGINYMDVKWTGTNTAGTQTLLVALNAGDTVAAPADAWCVSSYLQLMAGSLANLAIVGLGCAFYQADGTTLTNNVNGSDLKGTIDGTARRYMLDNTVAAALTARVQGRNIRIQTGGAGVVHDFTIRLYLPQVEKGAFTTSAIPTAGTAATRAVDDAIMTGTNFSSWYNASEGTLVTEAATMSPGTRGIAAINDNTTNERIDLRAGSASIGGVITDGGVAQASFTDTYVANTFSKAAIAYKLNDVAYTRDAAAVTTDVAATMPTATQFRIGKIDAGSSALNGWIKSIRYYRTRLTNAQLQALTA